MLKSRDIVALGDAAQELLDFARSAFSQQYRLALHLQVLTFTR